MLSVTRRSLPFSRPLVQLRLRRPTSQRCMHRRTWCTTSLPLPLPPPSHLPPPLHRSTRRRSRPPAVRFTSCRLRAPPLLRKAYRPRRCSAARRCYRCRPTSPHRRILRPSHRRWCRKSLRRSRARLPAIGASSRCSTLRAPISGAARARPCSIRLSCDVLASSRRYVALQLAHCIHTRSSLVLVCSSCCCLAKTRNSS